MQPWLVEWPEGRAVDQLYTRAWGNGAERGSVRYKVRVKLPDVAPEAISVVLRSSERVAVQTLDMFEIWGGELRFDHVVARKH